MLLAARESAVTKKPRLRLTRRRSSSVRPFGFFHSSMSRCMFTSWGIQWLAQPAKYLSQAHLYLNGTSWLTSVLPLMMRLSSALTRLATAASAGAASPGVAITPGVRGTGAAAGVSSSQDNIVWIPSLIYSVDQPRRDWRRGGWILLAGFAFLETVVAGTQVAGRALFHGRCCCYRGGCCGSRGSSRGRHAAIDRHRVQGAGTRGGFLHVSRGDGAQVVGGLQTAQPGQFVGFVQLLARGASHVDVQRLGLVDPFLTARGRFHQPAWRDFKRGRINIAQVLRMRSILVSEPSKYFRSAIITSSHRLRALRSRTR